MWRSVFLLRQELNTSRCIDTCSPLFFLITMKCLESYFEKLTSITRSVFGVPEEPLFPSFGVLLTFWALISVGRKLTNRRNVLARNFFVLKKSETAVERFLILCFVPFCFFRSQPTILHLILWNKTSPFCLLGTSQTTTTAVIHTIIVISVR